MPVIEKISKTPLIENDGTPCKDPTDVSYPRTFGMPIVLAPDKVGAMVRFHGYACHEAETWIEAAFEAVYDFVSTTFDNHKMENKTGAQWVKGDYDRLYDQLKDDHEKRIVCYVDYKWHGQSEVVNPFRDICTIKGERMEFCSRGHGYGCVEFMPGDFKTNFIALCAEMNVEWLDESGACCQVPEPFAKEVIEFVRDISENWDCDPDSHTYNTPCRKCEATELYKKLTQ